MQTAMKGLFDATNVQQRSIGEISWCDTKQHMRLAWRMAILAKGEKERIKRASGVRPQK